MLEKQKSRGSTRDIADIFGVTIETVHLAHHTKGHYQTIKPVKLPTGRLVWDLDKARAIFNGEATTEA
ncbi:MAG TPA: hypothetical protein VFV57_05815 [Limnobacter sp.]|nr:hypothetical protein [Limnobacter sp.]